MSDGVMAGARAWSPESWRARLAAHQARYGDREAVDRAAETLRSLPPLVTSWEIERLKSHLAEAQAGRRFVLQGGDCAERLADCRPEHILGTLKILLQMSLVLAHAGQRPVVRVGRFAGQYAKPRSNPTETREVGGRRVELPSYFGDLVNGAGFTPEARRPDPFLMVRGYQHAAMTLNFVRALTEGGFADMHHPEYWDLGFVEREGLPADVRDGYQRICRDIGDALRFTEAMVERSIDRVGRVEFFTSHEGLNLLYESAQTRRVPRRERFYCLTTHFPWIGERTRALDGAHVEFFRGIENPVGVKLGPAAAPGEVVELVRALNPRGESGKIVLIARMGAGAVRDALPPLIGAVRDAGLGVVWLCDPMHGNTQSAASGIKTRSFERILSELEASFEVHNALGSTLAGVHIELTGEHVTECVGGASGVTEDGLHHNYRSECDPRLNYAQSLELAFRAAGWMRRG